MLRREPELVQCLLCPRQCGVNRLKGDLGFCKAGEVAEVYRYGLHHGEEPPISGTNGSGTVFFSRCTLGCIYCQNFPWSQKGQGTRYSVEELAAVFTDLKNQGCHNWNLVSPTPWLTLIKEALLIADADGDRLPIVFNSSGYENCDTIDSFSNITDIYLVDLRYASKESSIAGSGVSDYVSVARKAVEQMWRQAGPLELDKNGVAVSGVICRLLILPGFADEVVDNLEWLSATLGNQVAISIMAQYTPAFRAKGTAWGRMISRAEYDTVCTAVERLGFVNGWIQDFGEKVPENLLGYEMSAGGD